MSDHHGINRRSFLLGLAGLGAALAVPVQAEPARVDEVWDRLLQEPWVFEVNDSGTIVAPDVPMPKTREDVFDVSADHQRMDWLISDIDCCDPLRQRFEWLASAELEVIQQELEDDRERKLERRLAGPAKRHLKRIETALLDEDWARWLALLGDAGLARFNGEIQGWLDEGVDWDEMEWFSNTGWSGQSLAMAFFEDLPAPVRKALGVVIVEGEHPGSTYFAAELRNDVEAANEEARRLGVPVRFRAEG